VPTPTPGAGRARERIHAAGLNFKDVRKRSIGPPYSPALPFVPGVSLTPNAPVQALVAISPTRRVGNMGGNWLPVLDICSERSEPRTRLLAPLRRHTIAAMDVRSRRLRLGRHRLGLRSA
jgi:hypothetical protein